MKQWVTFAQRGAVLALALLTQPEAATSGNRNIVVSGHLVCLAPDLKESPCEGVAATLAIKAANGDLYPLAAGKSADTLLQEKRLQTREFRLTLRETDEDKTFQIIKSQLIRAGNIYDFYYFCEICNITTYTPGPCMCCRAPTEYREAAAKQPG